MTLGGLKNDIAAQDTSIAFFHYQSQHFLTTTKTGRLETPEKWTIFKVDHPLHSTYWPLAKHLEYLPNLTYLEKRRKNVQSDSGFKFLHSPFIQEKGLRNGSWEKIPIRAILLVADHWDGYTFMPNLNFTTIFQKIEFWWHFASIAKCKIHFSSVFCAPVFGMINIIFKH